MHAQLGPYRSFTATPTCMLVLHRSTPSTGKMQTCTVRWCAVADSFRQIMLQHATSHCRQAQSLALFMNLLWWLPYQEYRYNHTCVGCELFCAHARSEWTHRQAFVMAQPVHLIAPSNARRQCSRPSRTLPARRPRVQSPPVPLARAARPPRPPPVCLPPHGRHLCKSMLRLACT